MRPNRARTRISFFILYYFCFGLLFRSGRRRGDVGESKGVSVQGYPLSDRIVDAVEIKGVKLESNQIRSIGQPCQIDPSARETVVVGVAELGVETERLAPVDAAQIAGVSESVRRGQAPALFGGCPDQLSKVIVEGELAHVAGVVMVVASIIKEQVWIVNNIWPNPIICMVVDSADRRNRRSVIHDGGVELKQLVCAQDPAALGELTTVAGDVAVDDSEGICPGLTTVIRDVAVVVKDEDVWAS